MFRLPRRLAVWLAVPALLALSARAEAQAVMVVPVPVYYLQPPLMTHYVSAPPLTRTARYWPPYPYAVQYQQVIVTPYGTPFVPPGFGVPPAMPSVGP